jgi:cytoskeletal protein CcmA (bactofilin family)
MTKKRLIMMGFFMCLLIFSLSGFAYGEEGGAARVGANVMVVAGEKVSGGLAVAGANVEVLGKVEGGLRACGANVVIPGEVQGEVSAFGANVILSGKYHGKVNAFAANVTLAGTFDKDVEVGAARITVSPTALIKGNLIYASAVLDRQKGSRITGEVIQREVMVKKERVEKWARRGVLALFSLGVLFWFFSIVALIIVGVIIYYVFPKKTSAIIDTISQPLWKNLWFGLIFLVVVPVAIIIAFITVVGIPAGIIAGLLYGIAIYISRIYIGVWVGRWVLGYFKKSMATAFFWPLVVGVVIIALLTLIPFFGCLVNLFILLLSLGAMWATMWKTMWKAAPAPARRRAPRRPLRKTKRRRR